MYYISHGGPGSGRYPLGSGERPYQKYEGKFGSRAGHNYKKKLIESTKKDYLEKGSLAKRTGKNVAIGSAISGIGTLILSGSPVTAAITAATAAIINVVSTRMNNKKQVEAAKQYVSRLSDTYNLNDLELTEETKKHATKIFDEYLNISDDSSKISDDEWGDRMKELENSFEYFKNSGLTDQDAMTSTTRMLEAGIENYKKGGYFN